MPLDGDLSRYTRGTDALRAALLAARRENLTPPPKLTVSEWAGKYAVLSRETSAQTGRFRAYAYQIGIQDACSDPKINEVVVMKSARVGFTKVLDHVVGYYLHQDPSPILVVQPRQEDAEDYSATEIEPMLRDCPALAEIAGDLKAKDSKQKKNKRMFRNGASITFVGANSPGGFRRITCRAVLLDEVDGYPVQGAGNEGDQVALAKKRSETFWNRLTVLGSTPTIKGESRIEKAWLQSDQRRFFVPCPQCDGFQYLEWGGPDTPHGMKWQRDAKGNGDPETVYYACKHCGHPIDEAHKPDMVARGEWRATNPGARTAGFHIWAGYSLHPNAAWSALVEEWLRVKSDALARQTFINLVLGEPYEDRGDKALAENRLLARREAWDAEVPDGVAVITAGVDVQDDRVELEFVGWGRDEESWSIRHEVVEGDPDTAELWSRVDAMLLRKWRRADGREFATAAACVDSGGHHTQKVYEFAKARLGRKVWAIKGESAGGGQRNPVWPTKRPSSRNKKSYRPIILGVNAAKDAIRARLHVEKPGPGYMHFPHDRDAGWFAQLVAERLVVKQANGQRYRVWECPPGRANEALDCRVYAYGALCGLMHFGLKLNARADAIAGEPRRERAPEAALPRLQSGTEPGKAGTETAIVPPSPGSPAPSAPHQPGPPPPPAPVEKPKRGLSLLASLNR